jgi:two-component system, OmpR family, response regulator
MKTATMPSVLQGLRVLVVDNNTDNCDLLRATLELHQMQVQTARTATQAVTAFVQAQPDILITDIVLPQEDGYTLLNKVRQLEPGRGGKALAIALTADMTQNELQAIAAGFAKFLLKPIDIVAFVTVLTELISKEEGAYIPANA